MGTPGAHQLPNGGGGSCGLKGNPVSWTFQLGAEYCPRETLRYGLGNNNSDNDDHHDDHDEHEISDPKLPKHITWIFSHNGWNGGTIKDMFMV